MSETLGQLVRRLRNQERLTQGGLAEKSGLSTSLISKFERDKASADIRESTLQRLADGLGLTQDSPDRRHLFEVAFEREQLLRPSTSGAARLLGEMSKDDFTDKGSEADAIDLQQDYSIPRVCVGMKDVADCAVWMLENTPKLEQVGEEEILVTTQGGSSIFRSLGQEARWSRAIHDAMLRNWKIVSLYRLTGDVERALEATDEIRDSSVHPEQYEARYVKRMGEVRPAYNLLIIPPIGALLALSTHDPAVVDTAFFYPTKHTKSAQYISSLVDHFNLLYTETTQLARTFKPRSPEWEDRLTSICWLEADEFMANNNVDSLTMPPSLHDVLLGSKRGSSSAAFRVLKTHQIQRREAFEHHVQSFRYLIIMPQRCFEDVVRECRYPVNDPNDSNKYVTVEKKQVVEHIEYLIRTLQRYNNFEIALIADNDPNAKRLLRTPWLVKGEASVLIEPYTVSEDGQHLVVASDLEITEPSVVRAFRQLFLDIWNEVPEKARQKDDVIGWLMQLLEQTKINTEGSRSRRPKRLAPSREQK